MPKVKLKSGTTL